MSKDAETKESHQTYGFVDYLGYLALRLVICCIQTTSLERCDRICRLLAKVVTDWLPIRKALLEENLQLIYPAWSPQQRKRVKWEMWHHLFLMCCEIAHAPRKIHRENWHQHYYAPNRKKVVEIILGDRPAVLVSGHFGNFELAGFVTGLFGIPSTTVARPLDNGYIHDYFMAFRSVGGQHFLPKEGSSAQVQELLKNGGKLALLADQHAGPKGCWVDFMGQLASCHKGLALFTLTSGAPMMVCSNVRRGKPLQFEFQVLGIADPLQPSDCLSSVSSLTRWYNECLERAIHACPEQYWWLHRRWRPPTQIRVRQAA
jgi:KDO2-lipid IV(A) lauroyltransferase